MPFSKVPPPWLKRRVTPLVTGPFTGRRFCSTGRGHVSQGLRPVISINFESTPVTANQEIGLALRLHHNFLVPQDIPFHQFSPKARNCAVPSDHLILAHFQHSKSNILQLRFYCLKCAFTASVSRIALLLLEMLHQLHVYMIARLHAHLNICSVWNILRGSTASHIRVFSCETFLLLLARPEYHENQDFIVSWCYKVLDCGVGRCCHCCMATSCCKSTWNMAVLWKLARRQSSGDDLLPDFPYIVFLYVLCVAVSSTYHVFSEISCFFVLLA